MITIESTKLLWRHFKCYSIRRLDRTNCLHRSPFEYNKIECTPTHFANFIILTYNEIACKWPFILEYLSHRNFFSVSTTILQCLEQYVWFYGVWFRSIWHYNEYMNPDGMIFITQYMYLAFPINKSPKPLPS